MTGQADGGLPPGWVWTCLGVPFEWSSGGTPLRSRSEYYGGDIPWAIIGDLVDGPVARTSSRITAIGLRQSAAKWVKPGSVLLAMYGSIGKLGINSIPLTTNQAIAFTHPNPIEAKYLFYYLMAARRELIFRGKGGTQSNISQAVIKAFPFVVAPLSEQRRIVAAIETYFTRLDAAAATLKRVQLNLERYRASVLKAAVEGRLVPTDAQLARAEGRDYEEASVLLKRILAERRCRWEETELAKAKAAGRSAKEDQWKRKYPVPAAPDVSALPALPEGWCWASWEQVSERVTVGHVGPMKTEYVPDGVPFLRGGNVRPNRYDPDDLKYVSQRFHETLSKSALAPGDVLIVRSGAVGTSCVVPDSIREGNCSDLVIVKRPIQFESRFGAYYMNSLAQAVVRRQQVGVALIHFNTKSAAALPIPLPPANEQQRIVAAVERLLSVIDELEGEVTTNLKRVKGLRQSVLKWAFAGRLVDQDPTEEPAYKLLESIGAERKSSKIDGPKTAGHRKAQTTSK